MARLNAEELEAAREWLTDCFETEGDVIAGASAARIERAVSRLFDGGIDGFIASCQPMECVA